MSQRGTPSEKQADDLFTVLCIALDNLEAAGRAVDVPYIMLTNTHFAGLMVLADMQGKNVVAVVCLLCCSRRCASVVLVVVVVAVVVVAQCIWLCFGVRIGMVLNC